MLRMLNCGISPSVKDVKLISPSVKDVKFKDIKLLLVPELRMLNYVISPSVKDVKLCY